MEEKIIETNVHPKNAPIPPKDDQLKPHEVKEIRDHLRRVREDENHNHNHNPPMHPEHHHKLPEWIRNPLSFIGMVALGTLLGMILFTLAFALSTKATHQDSYTRDVPVYVR